jgi:hypothetical protein
MLISTKTKWLFRMGESKLKTPNKMSHLRVANEAMSKITSKNPYLSKSKKHNLNYHLLLLKC